MLDLRETRQTKEEAGGFQGRMLPGLQEFARAMLSTTLKLWLFEIITVAVCNCTEISAYAQVLRMSFTDDGKYKMLGSTLLSAHFVPYSLSN